MNLLIILSVGYFIILWHLEIPCQDFSSRSFKTKKAEKLQGLKKNNNNKNNNYWLYFCTLLQTADCIYSCSTAQISAKHMAATQWI